MRKLLSQKLKVESHQEPGPEYGESKAGLLGSDMKHIRNLKGILTQTNLKGVLGSDKKHSQNQIGILTQTNLNGLLGSDQPGSQNGEAPHFSAAKPAEGLDAKTTYNVTVYPSSSHNSIVTIQIQTNMMSRL